MSRNHALGIALVIIGFVCASIVGLAINLATTEAQSWLAAQWWYSARLLWEALIIVLLLGGAVAVWQYRLSMRHTTVGPSSTTNMQSDRKRLIARMRDDWVRGFLDRAPYKLARLNRKRVTNPG
jgi:uncharacterized membrane protein YqjE